jgi:small-conductance mechanosensitive channel
MPMNEFWNTMQGVIVGGTFSWIIWVAFSTVRRYLIAKAKANLQEKVLQRIESSEALVALASNETGRNFLESITLEDSLPQSPFGRILFGVQAGIVLFFFGVAMLFVHQHTYDYDSGFMIVGIGAIGLGIGFLVAAVASVVVSRQLGLINREHRG